MNPIKHKVLDILYSRKSACLVEYFKSLDKSKRMNVKYFSCDMNKTFIDIAKTYFPNAKIVVDRYHFIRQVYWALEKESSGIKEFNAAITAFRNNYKYILNPLKYRHISNGPTEGFNNKIKVLKRVSYGVRNFTYFRNRILMVTA